MISAEDIIYLNRQDLEEEVLRLQRHSEEDAIRIHELADALAEEMRENKALLDTIQDIEDASLAE